MLPEIRDIRGKRKAAGLTQAALAEQAKCSKSMIAKIEQGKNEASYALIKRIFEAIEIEGILK